MSVAARNLRQIHPTGRSQWIRGKKAAPGQLVSVTIGLTLQQTDSAIAALQDISDPISKRYGQTWTPQEVVDAFKPSKENFSSVLRWLRDSRIIVFGSRLSQDGGYLDLEMSVADASRLLNTTFHQFSEKVDSVQRRVSDVRISCDTYDIPESIFPVIDYVSAAGTISSSTRDEEQEVPSAEVPPSSKVAAPAAANVSCTRFNAPTCLRKRYNIPDGPIDVHPENSLGVFQQSWVTWLGKDLDMFFELFDTSLVSHAPYSNERL